MLLGNVEREGDRMNRQARARSLAARCAALAAALALSACAAANTPPGLTAVDVRLEGQALFKIQVSAESITIGNRGLSKSGTGVVGVMVNRALAKSSERRVRTSRGLWRLKREGPRLVGVIEGLEANVEVQRRGEALELRGMIGEHGLLVFRAPDRIVVHLVDFDLTLLRERKGTRFATRDGVCRVQLEAAAMKKTKTPPEFVLLLLATELYANDVQIRAKLRPSWETAPTPARLPTHHLR